MFWNIEYLIHVYFKIILLLPVTIITKLNSIKERKLRKVGIKDYTIGAWGED